MTTPHTAGVDLGADPVDLENNRLMTIAEVCDYLAISRPTLHRFVLAGRLTKYRVGNSKNGSRFRFREVEALLEPVDVSRGSTAHPNDPGPVRAARVKLPDSAPSTPIRKAYLRGPWPRTDCPKCGTIAAYSPHTGRMQLHYVNGHNVCEVGHRVDQTAVFIPCD